MGQARSSIGRDSASTKKIINSALGQKEGAPRAPCALAESSSTEAAGRGKNLPEDVLHRQNAKVKLVQSVQTTLLKNLIL